MNRPRGNMVPVASLVLVAMALAISMIGLVTAPKAGATSSVIFVDPIEFTVGELDGQGVFTITLDVQPIDTVTIALSASDTTECTVDPPSLELTSENWEDGVTANVTAQDDDVDDGDQFCIIETDPAVSADLTFDGEDPDDVTVTVADDDTAGIIVAPTSLVVSEPDGWAVFTVTLNSEPLGNVTMGLTSEITVCAVTPDKLVITPENWQTGISATVTAVDDDVIDGPQSCLVVPGRTQSSDPLYDHILPPAVTVTVLDDDGPLDASIGDYVWFDENGDGIQDATETGLPGVVVYLDLNGNGALDDEPSATTNASGIYTITNLAAGPYPVRVDAATVPEGYYLTTSNIPLTVNLTDSEQYVQADFGYDDGPLDASIGDYVWFDENGDGIQDTTESGLPGVTVYLDLNENGVLDDEPSATTDADGIYAITGLPTGSYSVRVDTDTLPTGYVLTTNNIPLTVNLAESEQYDQADFGYAFEDPLDASIGDYVWLDENGDGVQDGTEPGLPDVVVYLDLNENGTLDDEPSATTDADGTYAITGLAVGSYTVRVDPDTLPTGTILTTGNIPLTVDLSASQQYTLADFGYAYEDPLDASIGDYVWFDENGDGVQDTTELGLSGVVVYLDLNDSGTLDDEPSATTDADGIYAITGLAAGSYLVRVKADTLPTGYVLTTGNIPLTVDLSASQQYVVADFGYNDYDPLDASIGDYVWFDQDGDGSQDGTEPGLPGVVVYLDLNENGTLDDEPSATTDADGTYAITGLAAGSYLVRVKADTVPTGYALTTGNLPLTVNLSASQQYVVADFGYEGYALTLDVVGGGSVTATPDLPSYAPDATVTLVPSADSGWRFDSWSGPDGPSVYDSGDGTWSLLMNDDKEVTAVFEPLALTPRAYLPLVVSSWPPIPSVPILDPIDNAGGIGSYTVSWSTSSNAESYVLQEATNSAFSDASAIYTGPATSYGVSGRGAARYYYRVKATNSWAGSDWSNVQQVDVLWEAEPNDSSANANGAIVPTLVYRGTFLTSGDVSDYYFFDLAAAHRVELWLTNIPIGQNYDLYLRNAALTVVDDSAELGNSDEHIRTNQDLPPGRYYIQVYHRSTGGSTQPYYLQFAID